MAASFWRVLTSVPLHLCTFHRYLHGRWLLFVIFALCAFVAYPVVVTHPGSVFWNIRCIYALFGFCVLFQFRGDGSFEPIIALCSVLFPLVPEIVDRLFTSSRGHELWAYDHSLHYQARVSRFAWRGAFDGCFILTCSDLCPPAPVHVSQVPARHVVIIRDFCPRCVRGSSCSHDASWVCFLKYPKHLCFVWILCFISI